MYEGNVVLCGSSAYTRKYYLGEDFEGLPEDVKQELQVMCVLFTEDVGGTLTLLFDEDGHLELRTDADEGDILYDEIGSVLKVKQIQREKKDLLEALELYYETFFMQ